MTSIHNPDRKCKTCKQPVGAKRHNTGPARLYCSTRCQMRHWATRNPRLTLPKGMTRAQVRKLLKAKTRLEE